MSGFTAEQITEIEKILKFIKQMDGIIRTSASKDQVERVRKEIRKYREKLDQMAPGIGSLTADVEELRKKLGLGIASDTGSSAAERIRENKGDLLSKIPIEKASPHCNDPDINLMFTVVQASIKVYWPMLSNQIAKLDYSVASERDAIYRKLENSMRSLRVLADTIEEYATAEKQDFREQLLKMKNKQSRVFLFEANDHLKELRTFLGKLTGSMRESVLNIQDTLAFQSDYQDLASLSGRTVESGIIEFQGYVDQAITKLSIPDIKPRT